MLRSVTDADFIVLLASHYVTDGNRQSKTCDLSALAISATVLQLMTQDASGPVHFSRFKLLSTQTEI